MAAQTILKVLVGSRAHGLARPDSDYDYRGVFIVPTSKILALDVGQERPKLTTWDEKRDGEKDDVTAWELGHYLHLATHCNPTILEVLAAPATVATIEGQELQRLFSCIWNPRGVRDAFIGYGLNQRKKFLEDKDTRPAKYATAYLRVLFQAYVLLTTGTLPIDLRPIGAAAWDGVYNDLVRWRQGEYSKGEVIDKCLFWQEQVETAHKVSTHQPDLDRVNDFLLKVRQENW